MRYNIDFIHENALRVLRQRGLEDADILVESMLAADISGVSTHGIKMLPAYIEKIDRGEFLTGHVKILKQTPAFTTVDAGNTIGAISATKCVEIAIEEARESGVHYVFSKNANTFGPAFFFAEKIAREGLIGVVCCNSPAAMPVNNGMEAMLGTNPVAFASPSKSKGTILLDMASSVVAKSRFLMAKNRGERLQEGWALDCNGKPTTDPDEAIRGLVLPMGGAKGYGIALMVDILSGLLSGAGYLNKVGKFYSQTGQPMNVGHLFIAIDPSVIYDGDFPVDMDTYIDIIRSSRATEGNVITIPGDRKYSCRKKAMEEGIKLDESDVFKLEELFKVRLLCQ